MEKQIQFTGILSNKAQENPGLCLQAFFLLAISKKQHDYFDLFRNVIDLCFQTFSTGIESSFVTAMVVPSAGIVRTRFAWILYVLRNTELCCRDHTFHFLDFMPVI